jgi:threonine efflux protein
MLTQLAARQGRGAALRAVLGSTLAALLWATAAIFGLQFVFSQAEWLLRLLQLAGGLYLLYLGIQLLCKPSSAPGTSETSFVPHPFWRGFTTSIANPKVVLFFGSIISTVMNPALPTWTRPAALAIITTNELVWYSLVAWVFSTRQAQRAYHRAAQTLDRIFGILLTAFGLRLTWSGLDFQTARD